MEEIIRRVASIDKKATDILKQAEEFLEIREKDIKEKIEAMREEIMDKTKLESKKLYETIISEAEAEALEIRNRSKEECSNLGSKFLKIREKLENQLFSHIFN